MNVAVVWISHLRRDTTFVFKAHRLCVSLNSRLESNKEEEEGYHFRELARLEKLTVGWITLLLVTAQVPQATPNINASAGGPHL